jgi:type VI secretion system protein ImpA
MVMSVIDIDELVVELGADEPCGPDLEYDPQMVELLRESEGKPEVQYGDTVTPAVPPEWKVVKKLALGLSARTRDLRVALLLLRSLMALHGMEGMAEGLTLVRRLLAERWDFVHPQLDPDDNLDPTMRVNALVALADPVTIVREFKECGFINLPGLGPFSLRQLEYVSGEVPWPASMNKLELTTIDASIKDIPDEQMVANNARLQAAYEAMEGIEDTLSRQVGSSHMINLDPLRKGLKRVRDFALDRTAGAPAPEAAAGGDAESVGSGTGGTSGARPAPISGEITSREDVSRMLDKICVYYAKYEPSSPVPLLLQRAQRLLSKSFFEILEDLAPDGLGQLQVVSGVRPTQESDY